MSFNKKFLQTGGIVASSPSVSDVDLSNATYVQSHTLSIGTRGASRGAYISKDGTKLYTSNSPDTATHYLLQYNFSTAFDVSSIGSIVGEKNIPDQTGWNYIEGCVVNESIDQILYDPYYTLNYYTHSFSTAGDITSIGSATSDSCSRSGGDRLSISYWINANESLLFMVSTENARKYSLSPAGDLSSATGCGTVYSLSGVATDLGDFPDAIAFNSDGTKYFAGSRFGTIGEYDLSTAYDISSRGSVTIRNFSSNIGSSVTVRHIQFNPTNTKMLLYTQESSPKVHEFNL